MLHFFVIIAARCLFFVHTRERERERKRKKEKSAQKRRTKILYLQNTRNVEKKQVVATAFLPRLERERERERLRNTLHNHAVFCQKPSLRNFCWSSSPTKGRSILRREQRESADWGLLRVRRLFADERKSYKKKKIIIIKPTQQKKALSARGASTKE